jgi:hypothetical protein
LIECKTQRRDLRPALFAFLCLQAWVARKPHGILVKFKLSPPDRVRCDPRGRKGYLKASEALPEPQSDLSLCAEAGLLVATDAGGEYEVPFARYGIFKLSTNPALPPGNIFP